MTGKKLGKEKVTPILPNENPRNQQEPARPETAAGPNTEHAAMTRNSDAVAAGPGNQLQENDTRSTNPNSHENQVKPAAQPDGTASIQESNARNEGIE